MKKLFVLTALGAAVVVPAFAQQPAPAPAPPPAPAAAPGAGGAAPAAPAAPGEGRGGARGGGRGPGGQGFQGAPGGPGGEGFQGRGGQGGPGGARGGRGPGGQAAQATGPAPVVNPTLQTQPLAPLPATSYLPGPVIPPGPLLPGTLIQAPAGYFVGMNVTDPAGILYGRVLSQEGDSVLMQTVDGKKHLLPVSELKIDHSTAVTHLTEAQIRDLAGPNDKKTVAKG